MTGRGVYAREVLMGWDLIWMGEYIGLGDREGSLFIRLRRFVETDTDSSGGSPDPKHGAMSGSIAE